MCDACLCVRNCVNEEGETGDDDGFGAHHTLMLDQRTATVRQLRHKIILFGNYFMNKLIDQRIHRLYSAKLLFSCVHKWTSRILPQTIDRSILHARSMLPKLYSLQSLVCTNCSTFANCFQFLFIVSQSCYVVTFIKIQYFLFLYIFGIPLNIGGNVSASHTIYGYSIITIIM